jgi:hypothetical protein
MTEEVRVRACMHANMKAMWVYVRVCVYVRVYACMYVEYVCIRLLTKAIVRLNHYTNVKE